MNNIDENKYKVIVVGAGQSGLAVGYYLKQHNIPFIILDANKRVGDAWRKRWNSLKLFTHAKFDGLPGYPYPDQPNTFPTKDQMADYLEYYADYFKLPIKSNTKIDLLTKEGNLYYLKTGDEQFIAENVIVAMSNFQEPKIPSFAKELDENIVQFHSMHYVDPFQFKEGSVLVVGAGNSGAEIALEAAKNNHDVWLSGRDTGHIPFDINGMLAKVILERLIFRLLFHRVFTLSTPIGKKIRPKVITHGGPLVRIKPKEIIEAKIKRISKITGVIDGLPVTEDKEKIDAKNLVWCTGFESSYPWINVPNLKNNEFVRGVSDNVSGLYFVGQHFQYAFSSAMIHGVGRDAKYIVEKIASVK